MRKRDEREKNGRTSNLAKNILAAGLAVGGAASFGSMDVFAAENDAGAEVATESQGETNVEQASVEVQTDVVSVETSEPVTSEPVVQTNDDGSETTTQTTTQTTTTYYVEPSTVENYENVSESSGEDRSHLYDQETTTTTTTSTTEAPVTETVDVSDKASETVEDIARDVADDINGDGTYTPGDSETSSSEDGTTTTIETGAVTDKESTFYDNVTTTAATTAEVTKTTTTETEAGFDTKDKAESWASEDGYANGSVTKGDAVTVETERDNYSSKQEAASAAADEAKTSGLKEGEFTVNDAEITGYEKTADREKADGVFDTKEAAEAAAGAKAQKNGYTGDNYYDAVVKEVENKVTVNLDKTYDSEDQAHGAIEEDAAAKNVTVTDCAVDVKIEKVKTADSVKVGEFDSDEAAKAAASTAAADKGYTGDYCNIITKPTTQGGASVKTEVGTFDTYEKAEKAAKDAAKAAGASEDSVNVEGRLNWNFDLDDSIKSKPQANFDNIFNYNYITTDGDLKVNNHTRGSVYVNGDLIGDGATIDDSAQPYEMTQSYVNGECKGSVGESTGRSNEQFKNVVKKDESILDGVNSVVEYWKTVANKLLQLGGNVFNCENATGGQYTQDAPAVKENDGSITIIGKYYSNVDGDGGDVTKRVYDSPQIYVYLGTQDISVLNWYGGFRGVLIAPNADVKIDYSAFCGTVVGKSITSNYAEAHLWTPTTGYVGSYEKQGQKYEAYYDGFKDKYTYAASYSYNDVKYEGVYDGYEARYKASYTADTWDASRDKITVQAKKTTVTTTTTKDVSTKKQSWYGDRKSEDVPPTPDTPKGPEKPSTPDTPDTPEIPDTPENPDTPKTPDAPNTPGTPDTPNVPDAPTTPSTPEAPNTPVTPGVPETPNTPASTETTRTTEVTNTSNTSEASEVVATSSASRTTENSGMVTTPTTDGGIVLGVIREQPSADTSVDSGVALSANKGAVTVDSGVALSASRDRNVATGDTAAILVSAALAGISCAGLVGIELFRKLRKGAAR